MARPIAVIYNQLLAQKNAQSGLSSLNSTSQVAIWNLWLWIVAAGQSLFEQLCDLFQTNLETITTNAPVFSAPWYQSMLLHFQYSATNPQVVNVSPTWAISYAVINTALNIITQAAVQPITNRSVNIKVASNSSPLSGPQISALTSYLSAIGIPGTQFNIVSVDPDLIYVQAQVFYDASYSGVIQANMVAALNTFLAAIPFNGSFEVSDLLEAMKAVPGVKDVILNNVSARQWNIPFGSGTYLVQANALVNRLWNTYAGYAIGETTSGQTFNDTITYTAQ